MKPKLGAIQGLPGGTRLAILAPIMSRLTSAASLVALGTLAVALSGCPIWSGDDDYNDDGCFGECCYGECNSNYCSTQAECGAGEVCGGDNECHYGDCSSWGCPLGEVCDVSGFDFQCIPDPGQGGFGEGGFGGGSASGGSAEGGGGEGGSGQPIYCGNPGDCGAGSFCAPDGTCTAGDCNAIEGCIFGFACDESGLLPFCARENANGCGADVDCVSGDGSSCISGVCTAPADKCFDQTQCPSGAVCADGKCTPSCAGGDACPSSYSCTTGVDLCTTPAVACAITNDCGGPDSVCVAGACVPRAVGGFCDVGTVWVNNGCIPDQSAAFVCTVDGDQDVCSAGSICLHHSCYISCETPNDTACDGLPEFDQCKSVSTPSGGHFVCGSAENLGDECDPTAGTACGPGFICVDGYCK